MPTIRASDPSEIETHIAHGSYKACSPECADAGECRLRRDIKLTAGQRMELTLREKACPIYEMAQKEKCEAVKFEEMIVKWKAEVKAHKRFRKEQEGYIEMSVQNRKKWLKTELLKMEALGVGSAEGK
jgi:hypothetical protein